jgi:lipoprotein-anchoring transpeptidase ErfK/SrfK
MGDGQARRYGVGVGKEGHAWSGTEKHHPQSRVAGLAPAR